jgi:hypothetical protein
MAAEAKMERDKDLRRQQVIARRREILATPYDDPVREHCRIRRYADHVILGGLEGMVERWENAVASIEQRSGYAVEEYRNSLDGRRILHEVFTLASADQQDVMRERVAAADDRFRSITSESAECVWGSTVAARRGYTREQHWWYYRWPRQIGEGWWGFPPSAKPIGNAES